MLALGDAHGFGNFITSSSFDYPTHDPLRYAIKDRPSFFFEKEPVACAISILREGASDTERDVIFMPSSGSRAGGRLLAY